MKTDREKRATRVTLYGAAINILLVVFKLIAGFVGQVGGNDCRRHPFPQRPAHRCRGHHLHEAQRPPAGRGPRLRTREI